VNTSAHKYEHLLQEYLKYATEIAARTMHVTLDIEHFVFLYGLPLYIILLCFMLYLFIKICCFKKNIEFVTLILKVFII